MPVMTKKTGIVNKHYAMLEEGKAPIGMHKGKLIRELSSGTLLYYADRFEEMNNTVYGCYIKACIDVALELGYIQARDEALEAARLIKLQSNHIGEIGQRLELECEITALYNNNEYTTNMMSIGSNIVKYFGASLGKVGDVIKIKCTIKRHDVYKDIMSTTISRPKVL